MPTFTEQLAQLRQKKLGEGFATVGKVQMLENQDKRMSEVFEEARAKLNAINSDSIVTDTTNEQLLKILTDTDVNSNLTGIQDVAAQIMASTKKAGELQRQADDIVLQANAELVGMGRDEANNLAQTIASYGVSKGKELEAKINEAKSAIEISNALKQSRALSLSIEGAVFDRMIKEGTYNSNAMAASIMVDPEYMDIVNIISPNGKQTAPAKFDKVIQRKYKELKELYGDRFKLEDFNLATAAAFDKIKSMTLPTPVSSYGNGGEFYSAVEKALGDNLVAYTNISDKYVYYSTSKSPDAYALRQAWDKAVDGAISDGHFEGLIPGENKPKERAKFIHDLKTNIGKSKLILDYLTNKLGMITQAVRVDPSTGSKLRDIAEEIHEGIWDVKNPKNYKQAISYIEEAMQKLGYNDFKLNFNTFDTVRGVMGRLTGVTPNISSSQLLIPRADKPESFIPHAQREDGEYLLPEVLRNIAYRVTHQPEDFSKKK